MTHRCEQARLCDLEAIRAGYDNARQIQRAQQSSLWPAFSDSSIQREIEGGRLWRVIDCDMGSETDGGALVGVFSVAYEDAAIWGERERGAHVYLHRIARAADYRGRGLVDAVLAWAHAHCVALGREGLRMDTWGDNEPLIAYYERLGFTLLGRRRIGIDARLPAHYHNGEFALLEMVCRSNGA